MKKKILLTLGAGATALAMLPLFAAFEAHVVNVTARIENALQVRSTEIAYGTVFPQEKIDKPLEVRLSGSFSEQNRVNGIDYVVRQKPKCVDNQDPSIHPQVMESATSTGSFVCPEGSTMMPLLCPYLSKHEKTDDGDQQSDNDSTGINSFHGLPGPWNLATTLATEVVGRLDQSVGDEDDSWMIDLRVPCFKGSCAQDWDNFVKIESGNQNIDSSVYMADPALEHDVFGCDLWLEVKDID